MESPFMTRDVMIDRLHAAMACALSVCGTIAFILSFVFSVLCSLGLNACRCLFAALRERFAGRVGHYAGYFASGLLAVGIMLVWVF